MAAQSQQVKEMVTIDLCNKAPYSDKRVPEGCKNLLCAAEKERLREEIKALKQTLADYAGNYDCYMLTPLQKKKTHLLRFLSLEVNSMHSLIVIYLERHVAIK